MQTFNSGSDTIEPQDIGIHLNLSSFINTHKIPFLYDASNTPPPVDDCSFIRWVKIYPEFRLIKRYSLTNIIVIVLIMVFLVSCFLGIESSNMWVLQIRTDVLIRMGSCFGLLVKKGEIYRLISSAFLHSNLTHIGLNIYGMYCVLPRLEACVRSIHLFFVFLLSAIGGNVLSLLIHGQSHNSVGASGGLFGFFGVLVGYLLVNWSGLQILGAIRKKYLFLILILSCLMLVPDGSSKLRVDIAAHLGGFLTGILCGMLVVVGIKPKSWILVVVGYVGLMVIVSVGLFIGYFL